MRKRTQAREYALQILYQLEMKPEPIEDALRTFWEEHQILHDEVRDFTADLVRGSLEHVEEIDVIIRKATQNWEIRRMAVVDRNIMRFAVYELLFVKDIPPKVTINEAVNIAKKFSQQDSGKFVNGVLDKINHTEKTRYVASQE